MLNPANTRVFQIFRTGTHSAMSGKSLSFSRLDIDTTAGVYCPIRRVAPLVLGHPQDNKPVFGEVTKVFSKGDNLYCLAEVSDDLIGLVKNGHYKHVSAAFYSPTEPSNPVFGSWYLRHVGFLGGCPPAIKSLAPLEFSETEGVFSFGVPFVDIETKPDSPHGLVSFSEGRYACRSSRLALHQTAENMCRNYPDFSYLEAVRLLERS